METSSQLDAVEAVVLSADAVGYSRLMADDARQTLATLKAHLGLMRTRIEAHRGRVVDQVGDNLLAEFGDADDAVGCAAAIQPALAQANGALPDRRRMPFRIGIHRGIVVREEGRLYGDGVNIAARLEGLALAGGVVVSEATLGALSDPGAFRCEYEGERRLKNIPDPVRAHRIVLGTEQQPEPGRVRPSLSSRPGLAVLRFRNRGADRDYLAEGVADDLVARLSAQSEVRVIARASSFRYREDPPDLARIGRELGVRYVLEGSVRAAGNRVRLTVRLSETESAEQLWAERYDREIDDIFAIEDEISRAIAESIQPELLRSETRRVVAKPSESLDSWECILRANWHLGRSTKEDTAHARRLLEQALSLDPESATARSTLGFCHYSTLLYGWAEDPEATVREIAHQARKAVALDARNPEAQVTMGIAHLAMDEPDRALAAWKYATELDPNHLRAHAWLGGTLAVSGSPDAALDHIEAVLALSPRDPALWLFLDDGAFAHFVARRYREAIDWAERSLKQRGERPRPYAVMAASHAFLDEKQPAHWAACELRRLDPDFDPSSPGRLLSNASDPSVATRLVQGLARAGLAD